MGMTRGLSLGWVFAQDHLDGDGVAMVFRRKLLGDGKHKSKHYSCEMADAASVANFPVTVEDNMREYSHREVAKAREARELMDRLAYASSSNMLELLRSGGLVNCGVTVQYVPLNLTMCVNLKNRGVDCVAAGLRSFVSHAKSRDFDIAMLRTDGEGAIGALIGDLGAAGS
jgi:hypothetical protein